MLCPSPWQGLRSHGKPGPLGDFKGVFAGFRQYWDEADDIWAYLVLVAQGMCAILVLPGKCADDARQQNRRKIVGLPRRPNCNLGFDVSGVGLTEQLRVSDRVLERKRRMVNKPEGEIGVCSSLVQLLWLDFLNIEIDTARNPKPRGTAMQTGFGI